MTRDAAACRAVLRRRARDTFFLSSLTLPPRVREPLAVLFAFCRELADTVAERDPGPQAASDIARRVDGAFRGDPKDTPVDRAFCRLARDYALPRPLFDAIAAALSWDADGRRYATDRALFDYCVRLGGAIAAAATIIMGRRKREVLERAFELGVAIELTTIACNVTEDARRGRVYLPIEWLEEAGVDADALLAAGPASDAVKTVALRVLAAADGLYESAFPGISSLPFDCRPAVRGLRFIYGAIGAEVERSTWGAEGSVSLPRRLRLLVRALRSSRSEGRPLVSRPMREAEALLAEVATG